MLLRTFLVEDRPEIRDTVLESMEAVAPVKFIGHADTERGARRWLQDNSGQWQLAIVDLFLAEGSGFGVLKVCQRRQPHQKVVVLTSYSHHQFAERCLQLGADMVFDKATELDLLVAFCHHHADQLNTDIAPLH